MHVVVLGAGYAGLTLTRHLERDLPDEADLTLVDESPDHLVQHELHRVIRRPGLADEITVSLADAVDSATVRVARVESIDRDERTVRCSDGTLSYDVCAICLGARTAYYDVAGLREHATPLKRLSHARRIRNDALDVLDAPSGASGPVAGHGARIVVGGAGLSGVQVAGELAELVRESGASDDVEVVLLEQYDSVAPRFRPRFQRGVREALEALSVSVRTGTTVTGVDGTADIDVEETGGTGAGVATDSGTDVTGDTDETTDTAGEEPVISVERADGSTDELRADQFVWTGGIRGPDALSGQRPRVRRTLQLDDRTFALGDAARVVDADGDAAPPSAQAAVRQARVAATNVTRLVEHKLDGGDDGFEPRLEGYTYESPGWLVSVGDDAVAQVGPAVLTGRAARAMKATVGVGYLSSVGAFGEAVDLAREEFRIERGR